MGTALHLLYGSSWLTLDPCSKYSDPIVYWSGHGGLEDIEVGETAISIWWSTLRLLCVHIDVNNIYIATIGCRLLAQAFIWNNFV